MEIHAKILLILELIIIGLTIGFLTLRLRSAGRKLSAGTLKRKEGQGEELISSNCPLNDEELYLIIAAALAAYEENKEGLIPVLSAAIAAYLGSDVDKVRVISFRKLPKSVSPWGVAGRMDLLTGHQ